ncbi:Pancreatic triacylglycerol lipase [Armadillidium vulgare]|nr:Pancreatic triacylglycerol lipase [Armadillidium vulgare]
MGIPSGLAHYNIDYRVSAYNLTSLINSPFDENKETKFVVHGFYHDGYRQWLKDVAAALLQYGDYNVLRVDWGKGSLTLPSQALANTKVVGEEIAYFVNTLKEEFNLNSSNCHCIGHSMGGYVCGFAGEGIDKLGRITALDPAPREFIKVGNNETLDPSDAEFVDAIHTGLSLLNILPSIAVAQPVGHLDFYVNEGYRQTGCFITLESIWDLNNNLEEDLIDIVGNEMGQVRFLVGLTGSNVWSFGTKSDRIYLINHVKKLSYSLKLQQNLHFVVIQHYVVSISTGIFVQDESPSGGVITFEVIGSTGYFTDKLEVKKANHGGITKSLFVNHVDVGQISSVKLTWKTRFSLLGIFSLNSDYILGVIAIKVSPLSHYPESS